jgi:hypothetical protein
MEQRQPYNTDLINRLHKHLVHLSDSYSPRDYDVRVDELVVVPRTKDPTRFFNYEDCIFDWTKTVTFHLYKGASRVAEKYTFVLKDEQTDGAYTQAQVEAQVARIVRATKQEAAYQQLLRKCKQRKRKIRELKEALRQQTEKQIPDQFSDLLSTLSKSFVPQHATGKDESPLGGTTTPDVSLDGTVQLESENGFSMTSVLSILESYRTQLGESQFQALLGTMLIMAQQPGLIPQVREFITLTLQNNEKE